MNASPEIIPIERFIAIDSHKHYVMVGGTPQWNGGGGLNQERQWILRPRKVQMRVFRKWALRNLKPDDAVVLETTSNV